MGNCPRSFSLAAYMIRQPLNMFLQALKEVVGEAADEETQALIRGALTETLTSESAELLDSAATRLGRSLVAVAYLRPDEAMDVRQLDQLRDRMLANCREAVGVAPLRMEFVFTQRAPYQ